MNLLNKICKDNIPYFLITIMGKIILLNCKNFDEKLEVHIYIMLSTYVPIFRLIQTEVSKLKSGLKLCLQT